MFDPFHNDTCFKWNWQGFYVIIDHGSNSGGVDFSLVLILACKAAKKTEAEIMRFCQEKILDILMEIRYDTQGDYTWRSL